MDKGKLKLVGVLLIVVGLVLSFVFPILAIVGIPYYNYPPSQTTPDGIPLNVAWSPKQNIAVIENITVVGFWLGVYLGDDADIYDDEGINIAIVRRLGGQWPDPEDNETKVVCLSIASGDIPRGTPALVKATITDVFDFIGSTRPCQFQPESPRAESFNLYAGREYKMEAWATDIREDFIIIDGLFWQWSNMAPPNDWYASYKPPDATNRIRVFDNVFSFKMNVGAVDGNGNGNGNGGNGGVDGFPPLKDPSPDYDEVSERPAIYFLGPLLFALGVGTLAYSMGWISGRLKNILLIALTAGAFGFMFYLSNYVVV